MHLKLLLFIFGVVVIAFLAVLNMTSVDVSVIFYTFKEVPLFAIIFFSFAIGCLVMLPFTFLGKKREKKKAQKLGIETVELKPEKKFQFFKKKLKETNSESEKSAVEVKKESENYES